MRCPRSPRQIRKPAASARFSRQLKPNADRPILLLYYITDRLQFPGDENSRRIRLLQTIAEAIRCGVDFIQLREKDLPARELEKLVREALQLTGQNKEVKTEFLVNSRTDIALACGAQ